MAQQPVTNRGESTYTNPVLHADYSDPDAIRVGNDYYMTASSFNCMPGLPILHSKDLVNWKLINHALPQLQPASVYNQPQHGKGVWAPTIVYIGKTFYIYYPDPDYGIFMISTTDPAKAWSEPQLVLPGKGIIDPSVMKDDDGSMYLAVGWAGSRAGINSLLTIYRLNATGTKTVDAGKHVYDGHGIDHTVEGPKLYKRNGYYYIFAPAGGVATGWQLVLRSKNIYGPYERKVVMDQGNTTINGPHQGAWVQTLSGEHWFMHFQDKGPYGRVVHLQPMQWKNNWPIIGEDPDADGKGQPVLQFRKPVITGTFPAVRPPENDEFNSDTLGMQWQWHANPQIQWSALLKGTGFLRLFAFPSDSGRNLFTVPNLLLQKFPALSFTATAKVKWTVEWDIWQGKKAGLLIMGNDYAYVSITKKDSNYYVTQVTCKDALTGQKENTIEQQVLTGSTAYLRVKVEGPDARCRFYYSEDDVQYKPVGQPFTATPDKWIGSKVGLSSTARPDIRIGGYLDVDWFRIEKDPTAIK
jgi:beta-xylosidase